LSNWLKVWALPARDKWLLAQSLVVLPVNGLALRLISFKRWQEILSRLALFDGQRSEAPLESLLSSAHTTATMVRIAAARGPYRGNCLPQSLTLWWLLRCQKLDGHIRFGARKEDDKLEAHAWVEFGGTALNEGRNIHHAFKPFERLGARPEANTR